MTVASQSRDAGQLPALGQAKSAVLRDQWDAHASEWIAWVRAPGRPDSYFQFHGESFLSMVPGPGRLTLDIGCGEGRVSRDLLKEGHNVLGIDCSRTMCQAAAAHPDFQYNLSKTHIIAGDATRLPLADGSVDCAIAFMCLQDIDDMPAALREIARVLEDGKPLALAIVHPMYSHGKASSLNNHAEVGTDVNLPRDYFVPELRVSTDQQDGLTVTFYREHRPLDTYMSALLDAGFAIEQWHEITDKDRSKPNHRLPMFLDVLATKKPRSAAQEPPEFPQANHHVPGRRPHRRPGTSHAGDSRSGGCRPVTVPRRGRSGVPQSMAVLSAKWFGPALIFWGTAALWLFLKV